MKKITFLLLFFYSIISIGQVSSGMEQEFDYGIKNNSLQTITTPTYIGTFGTDGTQGKIPSAYIAKTAAVQDSLNKKLNLPTGFLQGLALSINADPTKFNIAAGYYVVTDFTNLTQPVVKIINYAGVTGLTPAYLATANSTYVALDVNGTVISSASPFTDAQRRSLAIIGNVVHSNRTTINIVNEIKAPIVAVGNQLHDFMKAIGFLNESGNVYSANGANLQINKSVGDIFGMGINASDYLSPHKLTIPSQTALTFAYRFQNGTQLADTQNINPNIYDVGGTSTTTPSNKWTIQRINLFQSGLSRIQPGQTVYNSFNDAVVALPTQPFVTEQNIADNAVFRCYLIVQQGTTNLASAVAGGTAQFVPVDKFGNIIGNGSVALTYSNIVAALGFAPENVANKSDSYTISSSTTYATTKAVVDGLATKVNGSGTINTIPRFSGINDLVNSSISYDGANTTINGGNLVITGNTDGTRTNMFFKNNATNLGIIGSENSIFAGGAASDLGVYVYGNNKLSLATNNVRRLIIDGTGNLTFSTVPTTSAGTYDILTRNTSTGVVEKIQSSTIALDSNVVHKTGVETISGGKKFTSYINVYDSILTDKSVIINPGEIKISKNAIEYPSIIRADNVTNERTLQLPDASGTIALVETVKPYKVYTALLTQSGTSAPTATVLENTLGGSITWTYTSTGSYVGTLTSAFTLNKTWTIATGSGSADTTITVSRSSDNTVNVSTLLAGTPTNGIISPASIEIRVYN